MKKECFGRIAGLGWMAAAGLLVLLCPVENVAAERPMNILLISTEDWSADAIGAYGNEQVKTPNVDRLASKGVLFERAYSPGPVCNPARASLVTGLRPDSTRVYGNGDAMDEKVPEGAPSMAEIMQRVGAYTATTGKIVHKWGEASRFARGFDLLEYGHPYDVPEGFEGELRFLPYPEGAPEYPEDEAFLLPGGVGERLKRLKQERDSKLAEGAADTWALRRPFQQLYAEQVGDSGLPEESMEDGRIARSAAGMLETFAADGRQFFLAVGFYSTHTPLLAPKQYVDMYDPAEIELTPAPAELDQGVPDVARRFGRNYDIFNGLYPEYQATPERQRQAIAAYYACSSFVDAQVGYVLDALEANGLAENTIVIFLSDHGFQLGEHGTWSKFTLFEQSTRIPLVIYDPRAKGNGRRSDAIVELVDVLPTLCDLWGIDKDPLFEGTSMTPLLDKPDLAWKRAAYSMIPVGGLGRGVRAEHFRYAEWRKGLGSAPGEGELVAKELYDLSRDPWEQVNLIGDPLYREKQGELERLLYEGYRSALLREL